MNVSLGRNSILPPCFTSASLLATSNIFIKLFTSFALVIFESVYRRNTIFNCRSFTSRSPYVVTTVGIVKQPGPITRKYSATIVPYTLGLCHLPMLIFGAWLPIHIKKLYALYINYRLCLC